MFYINTFKHIHLRTNSHINKEIVIKHELNSSFIDIKQEL